MKEILVAVDFSDIAPRVLAQAADLARLAGSHLRLMHVAAPDPDFVGYEVGPQHVRDWRAHQLRDEHRHLLEQADQLRDSGLAVTAMLVQGMTADTILTQAQKHHADLIVLGSHGHGALYHLVTGSVSEAVLKQAKCPVLIVPANVTPVT